MYRNPVEVANELYPEIEWIGHSPVFTEEFGTDAERSIVTSTSGTWLLLLSSDGAVLYENRTKRI